MLPARIASALLVLCVMVGPRIARAQDDVQALVERGTAALRAERGAEARAIFARGLAVATSAEDRWRMHLGLALSHELTGDLVGATDDYRNFLRESARHPIAQSSKWQERRRRAIADLARLEERVLVDHAKLDLQTDPPGAQVTVDGEAVARRTPAILYLSPGPHRLELVKDGHDPVEISLVLEQGQEPLIHRRLELTPAPTPSEPPPPRSPTPPPLSGEDVERASLVVPATLVAATAGAALLSAGLLHGMAIRDANEVRRLAEGEISEDAIARDNQLRARIASHQRGYASLYAIGGAAAVAATAMLVYEIASDDESAGGAQLGAWAGPDGGGLSMQSTF